MIKNSYIYTGTVIHKRFKPKIHSFNYKVFSLLIDLSELSLMHKTLKLFSYDKFNIIEEFAGQETISRVSKCSRKTLL